MMFTVPLDVATAPMFLIGFGVPALIFAVVVALGVFAVKMIKRLARKSAEKEAERLGASTPPAEESQSDDTH